MGSNLSGPLLDQEETELSIQGLGLEMIPNNIPPDHPLKTLLASHNRLTLIPQMLLHLENLDISYNELDKMTITSAVLDYPELRNLCLSGNSLKTYPVNLSDYQKLTDLTADRNFFKESDTNPYENLPNLENIDLTLNYYKTIPFFQQSLVSLNLNFNYVRELPKMNLPNLRELRLAGNEIHNIAPDCSFPLLKVLDLSMNDIVDIPKISQMAPTLEHLYLSFNLIRDFPQEIPTTIVKIDVSYNKIQTFNTDLSNCTNLIFLDISFNQIKSLPPIPDTLETFNLEYNEIETCSSDFKMEKLQNLQFNHNKMKQLPMLQKCKANSLSFTHNQLEEISTENLGTLITRLDFTSNCITSIPESVFKIDKLQTINLTNNRITKIPDSVKFSSITALYLSQNDISELPSQMPSSLMTLHAICCKFTTFPEQLVDLPRLSFIDFSNNQIKEIKKFPTACRHLGFSCNLLETIPEIPDSVTFLDVSHNRLKELQIKGDFMMLQEVDISHNQIDLFSFENLQICNTLKLSHNPLTKFTLDYEKLPSIKYLDIVNTQIKPPQKIPDSIKELLTSDLALFQKLKTPRIKYCNPTLSGYSSTIGTRPTMEDSMIIREQFEQKIDLYSIIDGHGGSDTACISAYMIPQFFAQEKTRSIANFNQILGKLHERLKKAKIKDGATIAFAIVSPAEVSCAYLGDTRAIIVNRDRTIEQLTYDHRPYESSEISLIKSNRSYVSEKRTSGVLAISRAIGDLMIEGVSHVPDMTVHFRKQTDFRLVIGCDGVFDVLTQEEVGEIVCNYPDVNIAATTLRNIASARLTQDNVTVIVVNIETS